MALSGFIVDHICQPSASAALDGIASGFPVVAGNAPSLITFSSGSFTAPNTFNLTLLVHDLTGNQSFNFSHSVLIPMCDPAVSLTGGSAFDPALAGAFWIFALTMVLGVWLLAKNAGIILAMVKRW